MKEHIEVLQGILGAATSSELQRLAGTPEMAAVAAAIELMNAAKPLDEAAERERCFHAAERLTGYAWTAIHVHEEITRERAQARAEGYAQGVESQRELARAQRDDMRDLLTAQLSAAQALNDQCARDFVAKLAAAQAEIADLNADSRRCEQAYDALDAKLTAAQAEIERLKSWQTKLYSKGFSWFDQCATLETKLTNLRTAAERAAEELETTAESVRLRKAIEASR